MKSGRVKGGAAIPAVIDTGRRTRSNMAQPVFNASGLNRGVQGGAAQNIIQITSDDLVQNGGQYKLIGGAPIPMEIVTGRRSKQGAATVVYPVDMLGNYDPSFAGYIYKVLTANASVGYDPSSLIQFLPQNELAGAVSIDYSGNGFNGAYTAVNLGQPGVLGMGMSSAGYDGLTSYNAIHSAGLAAAFNGAEGTLLSYGQVANVGVWTDAVSRYLVDLQVDANNIVQIARTGFANNNIRGIFRAGGVLMTRDIVTTTLDFFSVAITWSVTANEVRVYFNGTQQGAALPGVGVWVGNLIANATVIGALTTVPASVWSGNAAPYLLYTEAHSPAVVAYLSTP